MHSMLRVPRPHQQFHATSTPLPPGKADSVAGDVCKMGNADATAACCCCRTVYYVNGNGNGNGKKLKQKLKSLATYIRFASAVYDIKLICI